MSIAIQGNNIMVACAEINRWKGAVHEVHISFTSLSGSYIRGNSWQAYGTIKSADWNDPHAVIMSCGRTLV